MKEPYEQGVANHLGPESCGDVREGISEALTGVSAGEVLSPEIPGYSGEPTPLPGGGRQHVGRRHRKAVTSPRDPRPSARTETYGAEIGRARYLPRHMAPWSSLRIYGVRQR